MQYLYFRARLPLKFLDRGTGLADNKAHHAVRDVHRLTLFSSSSSSSEAATARRTVPTTAASAKPAAATRRWAITAATTAAAETLAVLPRQQTVGGAAKTTQWVQTVRGAETKGIEEEGGQTIRGQKQKE